MLSFAKLELLTIRMWSVGNQRKYLRYIFFTSASYLLARVSATEILVGRKVRHYVRKLHLVITFAYFR